MEIKTSSDLKYMVEHSGKESHFFTRRTMKFFGDTMRNYGVRKARVFMRGDIKNSGVYVWELYRRRPTKHGLMSSAYFDMETFGRVFPVDDE